jgi:gliding motility-associated lipoprotein GldH
MSLFFRNIRFSIFLFFSLMFLFSCDSKKIFEENKEITGSVWNGNDKAIFHVMIPDVLARYNFYINVRNRGNYPFSNIYFFLKTIFPDGRIARDTIECRLADYDGKWLGSGISDMKFNRFLFQQGIKFPKKGEYTFELEQAMRVRELAGISDIGIRIEKQ